MPRSGSSSRRRNLHDERSEETRARLLEATIESLVAVGYARTSTTEIADRAGVSRGAQVYHYPTKSALVAAAVEHLLHRRHQELLQLFETLPRGADAPAAAIGFLWKFFEGPSFDAWLEFVVAARTDPDLRGELVRQSEPFVTAVGETLRKYLPTIAWNPIFRRPDFVFALLDGLALTRILYAEERSSRMLDELREIAEALQPAIATAARTPARRSKGTQEKTRR
jgi:AcrR family transcriptional regulator